MTTVKKKGIASGYLATTSSNIGKAMTGKQTIINLLAFVIAIFGSIAVLVKAGSYAIRYLLIKLYKLMFPSKR
jgi:hypothetical protein